MGAAGFRGARRGARGAPHTLPSCPDGPGHRGHRGLPESAAGPEPGPRCRCCPSEVARCRLSLSQVGFPTGSRPSRHGPGEHPGRRRAAEGWRGRRAGLGQPVPAVGAVRGQQRCSRRTTPARGARSLFGNRAKSFLRFRCICFYFGGFFPPFLLFFSFSSF